MPRLPAARSSVLRPRGGAQPHPVLRQLWRGGPHPSQLLSGSERLPWAGGCLQNPPAFCISKRKGGHAALLIPQYLSAVRACLVGTLSCGR